MKLCKPAFPRLTIPRRVPAHNRRAKNRTISRLFIKGVGRYLSASAAATRTTLHTNPTQNKSTPKGRGSPEIRDKPGNWGRKPGSGVVNGWCVLRHRGKVGASAGAGRFPWPAPRQGESSSSSWGSGLKRRKGRQPYGRRPFLKPLASGVLNYQEDFVMPGSSPR